MLVAVKNENNEVKCRFIPKTAKNIRTMSKGKKENLGNRHWFQ